MEMARDRCKVAWPSRSGYLHNVSTRLVQPPRPSDTLPRGRVIRYRIQTYVPAGGHVSDPPLHFRHPRSTARRVFHIYIPIHTYGTALAPTSPPACLRRRPLSAPRRSFPAYVQPMVPSDRRTCSHLLYTLCLQCVWLCWPCTTLGPARVSRSGLTGGTHRTSPFQVYGNDFFHCDTSTLFPITQKERKRGNANPCPVETKGMNKDRKSEHPLKKERKKDKVDPPNE